SRGDYHWQHECCWYAVRDGGKSRWQGSRSESTLWTIGSKEDAKTVHGTQKPVECMRRPMLNSSAPGDAVYEPFSGSGTSIIAAESCRRRCLAVELDPRYVDMAVERFQDYAHVPATLAGTGRTFEEVARERAA
ncbi:MAG: site-specific DNA-methyltransferase, partial [Synergistaceae bacterium]|nr:site-specific DNA-methyltransferase [Synergistaceae bacterium]